MTVQNLEQALMVVIERYAESMRWEHDIFKLPPDEHMKKQAREFEALAELLVQASKEANK